MAKITYRSPVRFIFSQIDLKLILLPFNPFININSIISSLSFKTYFMDLHSLQVVTQWLGANGAIISWPASICQPFTIVLQTHDGFHVDHNKLPLVGVTYPPDTSAGWEEETRFSGIFFNMGGEQALGASTSIPISCTLRCRIS